LLFANNLVELTHAHIKHTDRSITATQQTSNAKST